MNRIRQMAAFATFFTAITVLLNFYIFSHLFPKFGLERGWLMWIVIIASSVSLFLGMAVTRYSYNTATRLMNTAFGLWLGFLMITLFLLLGYDIIRLTFYRPDPHLAGRVIVGAALALVAAGALNARIVRTKRVRLACAGLSRPVRIVQLSDIHLGSVHGVNFLDRLVELANAERPDYVMITGDLADGPLRYNDSHFAALNRLAAPAYFVPGNHDEYAGLDDMLALLSRTKVKVLLNRKVDLGAFELLGVGFDWSKTAYPPLLAPIAPSRKKFSILLAHGPPAFDEARRLGVDLTLSGHTHGGQFWPFTAFGRVFVKYRLGLYEKDGKRLFVTAGVGTWGPPIRLGTSSEIAVLALVPGNV